jgi:hypothetical protein
MGGDPGEWAVISIIILGVLICLFVYCYNAGLQKGFEDGWHAYQDQNRRHDPD